MVTCSLRATTSGMSEAGLVELALDPVHPVIHFAVLIAADNMCRHAALLIYGASSSTMLLLGPLWSGRASADTEWL
jgi:hypothetical protein